MSRWKNSPWEFILLYEELDLNMVKVGSELSTSTTSQKKKEKRKKKRAKYEGKEWGKERTRESHYQLF